MIAIKNKDIRMEDAIIVAGTPRSGSTWIMDLLGWLPGYTILYEPFHPQWFRESYTLSLQSRPYLPLESSWIEGEKYVKKVLSGKIISENPYFVHDKINSKFIVHRLLSNKLIVKSIRANRLLPWIHHNFKVKGIIFIIRHPCAVIYSQLKTGYTGYHRLTNGNFKDIIPDKNQLRKEVIKIEPYHPGIIEKIKEIEGQEEILTVIWCIDNLIPLSYDQSSSWYILPYERLITKGIKEVKNLFNWLEKDIPVETLKQFNIPSIVTREKEPLKVTEKNYQLSKWKRNLSNNTVKRILKIVSDFGLRFYTENLEPDYHNLENFQLTHSRSDLILNNI